jgi:hypothetical protein
MSGKGFHVHGPHDHELEHAGHGGHDPSAAGIAVATAIIATVGALFSYMGGLTQANAGLYKNNAAIKKTEAANQWNFYQAKSSKQNLSELAIVLVATDDKKAAYKDEVERYKKEKAEIKLAAEKLEKDSADWDEKSDSQLHLHHRWAQATTALQISIALAAMALLTKKRWLEWGMYGVASLGVGLGVAAAMHV